MPDPNKEEIVGVVAQAEHDAKVFKAMLDYKGSIQELVLKHNLTHSQAKAVMFNMAYGMGTARVKEVIASFQTQNFTHKQAIVEKIGHNTQKKHDIRSNGKVRLRIAKRFRVKNRG